MSRILVAGLLGAVAMFFWTAIAHMVTPLGQSGMSGLPNEATVAAAVKASAGDKGGLYIYPWEPAAMSDKAAAARMQSKMDASGSALVFYQPPGKDHGMQPSMLVEEFIKQLVVCVIAAFLLAEAKLPRLWERAGFVAAIGAVASLETNASYRIWYMFPGDFTAAAIAVSFIGYIFAGLAIGWWLKPALTPKPID